MSPWNILSRFRSKQEGSRASAASLATQADLKKETEVAVSESVPLVSSEAGTLVSETKRAHVHVRLTAHESANKTVVTKDEHLEPETSLPERIASEDNSHKLTQEPREVTKGPSYDLRATNTVPKKSRVSINAIEAKPVQAAEVDGYLTAMVGLDDDIKQLRATLARKLEAQNDQLRTMLSRFDLN